MEYGRLQTQQFLPVECRGKKHSSLLMFIQEHWFTHHEATDIFSCGFKPYNFLTTSADMFLQPEDIILQSGPVWHGTSIGWLKNKITCCE